jgi:hypothetical protein
MEYLNDLEDLTDDPFSQQRRKDLYSNVPPPLTEEVQRRQKLYNIPDITQGPGPQIPNITEAPVDPQARYQKMLQDGPNMQGTNPSVLRRILGGLAGMASPELGGKITNWKGLGAMNRYNQDLGLAKQGAAADIADRGLYVKQRNADTNVNRGESQAEKYVRDAEEKERRNRATEEDTDQSRAATQEKFIRLMEFRAKAQRENNQIAVRNADTALQNMRISGARLEETKRSNNANEAISFINSQSGIAGKANPSALVTARAKAAAYTNWNRTPSGRAKLQQYTKLADNNPSLVQQYISLDPEYKAILAGIAPETSGNSGELDENGNFIP